MDLDSNSVYQSFLTYGAEKPFWVMVAQASGYNEGDEACVNAIEIFCYNVARFVGAYVAAMNGVDAIAFTAGIGENSGFVRGKVCEYLGYLGITIDPEENAKRGENLTISTPDSKVKVCVIPTNEELMIARDTKALVEG